MWDTITHTSLNCNGALTKLLLKLGIIIVNRPLGTIVNEV